MSELCDVLDRYGNKTGEIFPRGFCIDNKLCYKCAIVWVVNNDGNVLIQKRSETKRLYPGKWDKSVGGGVSSGETSVETALRETAEEIGLNITEDDLIYLGTMPSGNLDDLKVMFDVFVVVGDYSESDFTAQKEEVSELKFVSPDWIENHTYKNDSENSILGDGIWKMLKHWLESR